MQRIAFLISLILLGFTSRASACTATESALIAGWEQASLAATYAVMAFERAGEERRFDSWRHERPEVSQGAWKLDGCSLMIFEEPDEHKRLHAFKVLALTSECLILQEDDGRKMSYRKIDESPSRSRTKNLFPNVVSEHLTIVVGQLALPLPLLAFTIMLETIR